MRGFSKAIVAGNITRDPEMRMTTGGSQVCSFAIAVNRSFKDSSGNQQDQVSYIDCVAWGKSAELICQYVHKGSALLVSGRLEQRSWEDKNSGQRRSRTEIVVEDFSFIGGTNGGGAGNYGGGSSKSASSASSEPDLGDSDIVPDDVPEDQINLDEIPF